MRSVDSEKFLADYDALLKTREEKIANRDAAIEAEKTKAEKVISDNNYSDRVKELLIAEVVTEKEKEFDLTEIDGEIAVFEKYIVVSEDVEDSEDSILEDTDKDATVTPETTNDQFIY